MPYKKSINKQPKCDPDIWAWLNDNDEQIKDKFFHFMLSKQRKRELWELYREEVLEKWIETRPGTRPSLWWECDAPEAREQLRGNGLLMHEKYAASLPHFSFGVPDLWHEIDEGNPPFFESEASFLARHDLLLPSELKKIKPADYKPVSILDILIFDNEEA